MNRTISKLAVVFFITLYGCSEKNKSFHNPIFVNTVDGPIEFHGLKKWTIADIEKAINHVSPGESLHACAQILEDAFDFPEASVIRMRQSSDTQFSVITLLEPDEKSRIQYNNSNSYKNNIDLGINWDRLIELKEKAELDNDPMFNDAVLFYSNGFRADDSLDIDGLDINKKSYVAEVLKLLEEGTTVDTERLIRVLNSDSLTSKRIAASLYLLNKFDDDKSWNALVKGIIDPNKRVRETSRTVLNLYRIHNTRNINWTESIDALRNIFNGTDLFSIYMLMDLLVKTNIDPTLGKELLRSNYEFVYSYLLSKEVNHKEKSLNLLNHIHQGTHSNSPDYWLTWLKSL